MYGQFQTYVNMMDCISDIANDPNPRLNTYILYKFSEPQQTPKFFYRISAKEPLRAIPFKNGGGPDL